jgi:cobyrinic acid a,c-diamide synthase
MVTRQTATPEPDDPMDVARGPARLVIAAAASSAGKTTIATGLMGALRASGREVAGFKVGPDFIDPGYHALATGRPGRNLDAVLTSSELVPRLLLHGLRTPTVADVAVIEGVMGLFDGQLGRDGYGSTAHIARLLDAPVVLVVDAAGSSRTAAAAALGLRGFDPSVRIAGVVVNRVGSPRHAAELRGVFERAGLPVLGVVPRSADIAAPSRHLGLVPVAERDESEATVAALAATIAEHVDLDSVMEVARSAPGLDAVAWDPAEVVRPAAPGARAPRIGVMAGRAFTFRYAETTELLVAAGCEIVELDPLRDDALPAGLDGLYIGGGFPQVHATSLSGNASLARDVAAAIAAGMPTVAECAGQLYLGRRLDGHPMAGALPLTARMTPRLTLGYRHAVAPTDTLLAAAGTEVVGHEFHRTQADPGHGEAPAWEWDAPKGHVEEGHSLAAGPAANPTLHASYLHVHWAGYPECAQRFADAAAAFAVRRRAAGDIESPGSADAGVPHPQSIPQRPVLVSGTAADRPPAFVTVNDPAPPAAGHSSSSRIDAVQAPHRADGADEGQDASPATTQIDLDHHGDKDIRPGLVDLAVNVRCAGPPAWLADEIAATIPGLGAYPDAGVAREVLAAAHGVPTGMVLPTAGGSEAFSLVARALTARHPLVVHPQFTEPEAALRAAGHAVQRWLLPVHPGAPVPSLADLPRWADAVFVGNPTNPTGWLHPRADLLAVGAGRLLVVDEAFMDATDTGPAGSPAGERESLISTEMEDVLVLRSLSKTWGLAGLRVGYIVGDPRWIARLAPTQPHWPLSAPAIASMVATATPRALAEARAGYRAMAADRDHFVAALSAAGFGTVGQSAPFVLIDTSPIGPDSVREPLADLGFAVRRAETFPGLGPTWIRSKVPAPDIADAFVAALASLLPTPNRQEAR